MIVDTSVWIHLYRSRDRHVGRRVAELAAGDQAAFCGPVYAEFMGGFRPAAHRREQEARFAEFPWLNTPREAYELAAQWLGAVRGLGTIDAIIAATAKVNRAGLMSLDADFDGLVPLGLELISIVRGK